MESIAEFQRQHSCSAKNWFPCWKGAVCCCKVPIRAFYRKYYSRLELGNKTPGCLTCQYNFHLHWRYELFTALQTDLQPKTTFIFSICKSYPACCLPQLVSSFLSLPHFCLRDIWVSPGCCGTSWLFFFRDHCYMVLVFFLPQIQW